MESGVPSPPGNSDHLFSTLVPPVQFKPAGYLPSHAAGLLPGADLYVNAHIDHLRFNKKAAGAISCNLGLWFDSNSDYPMPLARVRDLTPARLPQIDSPLAEYMDLSTSKHLAQPQVSLFPPSGIEKCKLDFEVEKPQGYREAGKADFLQRNNEEESPTYVEHFENTGFILDEDFFDGDEQMSIGYVTDYDQDSDMIEDVCESQWADWKRESQADEHIGTNEKSEAEDEGDQTQISGIKGIVKNDQNQSANYDGPPLSETSLPSKAADLAAKEVIEIQRKCSVLPKPHYLDKQRPPPFDTGMHKLRSPLPQPAIPLAPSEREKKEESQRKPVKRPVELKGGEAANVRVTSMLWRCWHRGVLTIRKYKEIMKRQQKPGRARHNPVFKRRYQRIMDQDPKHTICRVYKRSPLAKEVKSKTVHSLGCSMHSFKNKVRC